MPDNDDLLGGGMMSQAELDALMAAAGAGEDIGDGGWTAEEAVTSADVETPTPSAAAPHAAPATMSLPSFSAPAVGAASADAPTAGGLGRVRDIPLEVTVELGRTRLLIKDILDLGTGSIIELDKIAGEPVELYANGLLMARGEVIVIDDNFGVRVTEIITAAERTAGKEAHALAA